MLSYAPLWETLRNKGATTYTLRAKAGISGSTVLRLQKDESVSSNTFDILCRFLDCRIEDIIVYIPDEE